jgi:hypothetical protein
VKGKMRQLSVRGGGKGFTRKKHMRRRGEEEEGVGLFLFQDTYTTSRAAHQ